MSKSTQTKILNVLTIIMALLFIIAGANKIVPFIPMPEEMPIELQRVMDAYNEIGWLMPLIGIAEVLGGILLIIPKTRLIGMLVVCPVLIGIVFNDWYIDRSALLLTGVLIAIWTWNFYVYREKFYGLLN